MKDAVQQDFKNADVAVELVRILFFGLSGTPQRRLQWGVKSSGTVTCLPNLLLQELKAF